MPGPVVVCLLAALAVVMAMLLSLWHTRPAARSGFAARHRESKLLALMEMVMSMLLGVTTALLVVGSAFMLLPLALASVRAPDMTKWVYTFGDGRAEGESAMRDLLGGDRGVVFRLVHAASLRRVVAGTPAGAPAVGAHWMARIASQSACS